VIEKTILVAGFAISAPFGNVKMALAAAGKIDVSLSF
jgi:hypothetical protein